MRPRDAEPIRLWRNAQLNVLRQKEPLSYADQQAYFANVIRPEMRSLNPRQILLALVLDLGPGLSRELVGYGGLTYIDWSARRAELSFLADPEWDVYNQSFLAFLGLIRQIAFEDLDLRRVWHETSRFRRLHVQTLEEFGFKREGVLRDHVYVDGTYFDGLIYGMVEEGDDGPRL